MLIYWRVIRANPQSSSTFQAYFIGMFRKRFLPSPGFPVSVSQLPDSICRCGRPTSNLPGGCSTRRSRPPLPDDLWKALNFGDSRDKDTGNIRQAWCFSTEKTVFFFVVSWCNGDSSPQRYWMLPRSTGAIYFWQVLLQPERQSRTANFKNHRTMYFLLTVALPFSDFNAKPTTSNGVKKQKKQPLTLNHRDFGRSSPNRYLVWFFYLFFGGISHVDWL